MVDLLCACWEFHVEAVPYQSCMSLRLIVEVSDERWTNRVPAAVRALSSYMS